MEKLIFILMVVCACMSSSCTKSKEKDGYDYSNRVITDYSGSKESGSYLFRINVGHNRSVCGGKCIQINGILTHADCMGFGYTCPLVSSVTMQQTGTAIIATTTDTFGLTSENFFAMPARSLYFYTEDNNNIVYLNIPEQMVYRDTATLQFTFTGLFLTNVPEYNND